MSEASELDAFTSSSMGNTGPWITMSAVPICRTTLGPLSLQHAHCKQPQWEAGTDTGTPPTYNSMGLEHIHYGIEAEQNRG